MLRTNMLTAITCTCLVLGACGVEAGVDVVAQTKTNTSDGPVSVEPPTAIDCWEDITACQTSSGDRDNGPTPTTSPPVATPEQDTELPTSLDEYATMTPAQLLDDVSESEIEAVGGYECALELADISLALVRYVGDVGREPRSMALLVDEGYLVDPLTLWSLDETSARARPDGACIGHHEFLGDPTPQMATSQEECDTERRIFIVAIEAYRAHFGPEVRPSETELVESGMVQSEFANYEAVFDSSGAEYDVVVVDGSICR